MGIVAHLRWDELSSALLQCHLISARYYLVAIGVNGTAHTEDRANRDRHSYNRRDLASACPLCRLTLNQVVLSSRQLARSTSTVSNRREWITGYTAAARTSTTTAATPVRSGSGQHTPVDLDAVVHG